MSCPDLARFFDGELSDAEAEAVRQHLATCELCDAALAMLFELDVVGHRHNRLVEMEAELRQLWRRKFNPTPPEEPWEGEGDE
jgi:anti-sigma factor RsiW